MAKICTWFVIMIFVHTTSAYAETGIAERKKQLIREEEIIRKGEKSKISNVPDDATLDDYIRLGLKNNPGIKAAFYKWKSSFKKISKEFSLPDPQFTFTEYVEEVETRAGPQEKSFSIKQKLPMSDKLWLRRSKAFKASEKAYYLLEKKQQEIIYQITDAYYEYAYLSKAILLTEENIKLLKDFERVVQAKYKSDLAQNQELLKVQVELGTLENDLYSLKDLQEPLVVRLNTLLNLPSHNTLPWPAETLEDPFIHDEYSDVESLYNILKESSPEILALEQGVEQNKAALKLAKRQFFPDLTVGVTHIDTSDALNPNTVDSGKDPLMVTLSVNVPLWFNRINAGVQDAKASLKSSENMLEEKENQILSKLAFVHYKLRDSLRQSNLYKNALLPKASQTLKATQSGYEGGKIGFLSLIDAQRVLLNFQLAYYRHNANFYQRLSELKSLLSEVE